MAGYILIVDDMPDNLELLARTLRRANYQVDFATNGIEALHAVEKNVPDLILLDIAMPGMDGYKVCAHLKADARFRDIPVIFISAMEELIDKVRAFDAGGVDYITKPFQFAEVLARVRTQMEIVELRRKDKQLIDTLSQEIQERQRTEAQNRYLAGLVESVSDAVISTDADFCIVSWNRAAESLYGWQRTEAIGQILPELIRTEYMADTNQLEATTDLLENGHWEGEVIQYRRDRSTVDIYSAVSALYDEAGKYAGAVAINRDITAYRQSERRRVELALYQQKNDFLRDFLANVSHDIRTPLTVIHTSLYLLERYTDPEQRRRKLNEIKIQANLLENIIHNVITMSRLDTVPELHPDTMNVNDLLEEVAHKLQATIEKKAIAFTLSLDRDLPNISADRGQLYRVFINLVENALHYTPEGGSVTVRSSLKDHMVVVEVIDTGIGISAADLPRIFERFYRSDKARAFDSERSGSGLGLAIARSIVEMHGGVIEVDSKPGLGSTFRVRLPLDAG